MSQDKIPVDLGSILTSPSSISTLNFSVREREKYVNITAILSLGVLFATLLTDSFVISLYFAKNNFNDT